ncbi:nucleotidyltransferase family protein [Paraglaciecola hydrolytica]|uniref:MobA-like NTP transferase domain-containing protein n=1 Tax=Paraglaciecola hydrolytica TaxID=1799789 RepID=A0A136A6F7_9ALTE|nr:nucleotidyltransferase family protein [Paraglaciecola hydrolytica]KXI30801.1 hypothetical protein AX660_05165 [Paraglaciecola hydrolytica]
MILEAVMLAAGKSQRFAGVKQLALINGRTMLEHCLSQYFIGEMLIPQITTMTVVLGANKSQLEQCDLSQVSVFTAANWQQGMGASLADFVKQLPVTTSHLLIGLADQVALKTPDFVALIESSQQNPEMIICAQYGHVQGVPAIIPRRFFAELSQLNSDKGARALINQYPEHVHSLAMPNAAIDIDTQQDLNSLSNFKF